LDDWQALISTLEHPIYPEGRRESARKLAGDIQRALIGIFPMLEDLCRQTCPWCPDPCCLNARLWFDFKDILFLYLTDQGLPQRQPCSHRNQPCSYLGPKGCRIPRLRRPFVRTWFICPTQKAILQRPGLKSAATLQAAIERIKTMRKQLASECTAEHIF